MGLIVCTAVLTLIAIFNTLVNLGCVCGGTHLILDKLRASNVKHWQSNTLMYPSSVWKCLSFSFLCSKNFYVKTEKMHN